MEISKTANLIIYRIREKGLEIFLLNSENDSETWHLPVHDVAASLQLHEQDLFITLDPVHQEDGRIEEAIAVEGDWHDIPSLKSLLLQDVFFVKNQLKEMIPAAIEKGAFVAVKEAFKKVLPHQYKMLKELKDVLTDRNSVKYM